MTIFAADGAIAAVPLAYDIMWLLAGLAWLLIPVPIAVTERRRGASWPASFLWFVVPLLLPVVGLILWALHRIAGARRATSR